MIMEGLSNLAMKPGEWNRRITGQHHEHDGDY
jgi:hypothetical protein